jgi:hypothetical protein
MTGTDTFKQTQINPPTYYLQKHLNKKYEIKNIIEFQNS